MTPVEPGVAMVAADQWVAVVGLDQLEFERGVAVRVGDHQVAIFRLRGPDEIVAVDQRDPVSRANVISRGIVGDKEGEPKVASPIYKQTYSLRTGVCFEDPATRLAVHEVRVRDGTVEVRRP